MSLSLGHVGAFRSTSLMSFASGMNDLLPDVADHFVGEDDHGNPEPLGQVEGLDRVIEHLLRVGRGQADQGVVPVGTVTRLVQITLGGRGGLTRAGPPSHDFDDDAGCFLGHRQTNRFLHETKTRTARRGHGLGPPPGGAHDGHERCDLIFELQTETIDHREFPGEVLQDLRGRRNRIAAVEAATRQDGCFRACLVSQHYLDTTFFHGFLSSFFLRNSVQ